MSSTSMSMIDSSYREFKDLRDNGAQSSAFIRLAEILNQVANNDPGSQQARSWGQTITDEIHALSQSHVCSGLARMMTQLKRIVSVSGHCDEDEILLVLTLRTQLKLAALLGNTIGWDVGIIEERSTDDAIRELLFDPRNRLARSRAETLVKRNWRLSSVSEWIDQLDWS